MKKKEITIFGWSLLAACFITIPFLGIILNTIMLIFSINEYKKNKSKYIKAAIIMSLIIIAINILVTLSMVALYNHYSGLLTNPTPDRVFRAMQYNMR